MSFKKGDIAALIKTTVAHYAIGTGREATKHHTIEIVRVASASRDGRVKSYQVHARYPVYKHHDPYGRVRFMSIGGQMQAHAARLFATATDTDALRFDDQEAAKNAITNA